MESELVKKDEPLVALPVDEKLRLNEPVGLRNVRVLRQAFVVASLIIVSGYVFGALGYPYLDLLPLLVAGGLMFSGLTGFCPMVAILQLMPWNKK